MTREIAPRTQLSGVAFAMAFPSVLTLTYFVLLAEHATQLQQAVYATGKTIQFAFPVAWAAIVLGERLRPIRPRAAGLTVAVAFGLLVSGAMLGLYFGWLRGLPYLSGPAEMIRMKLRDLGLNTLGRYAAAGVFYAACHSLLEEYYWRWFVFGQLRRLTRDGAAIALSSLAFMAHHVILLATYFGWNSPLTYLFSGGVGIGGAVWAWIYLRSRSLYGPWLSHCLVDAAIFFVGYDLGLR